jgi:hypothetical protein
MRTRRFAIFTVKVMAAHVTTYFLAGTIFYPLLTEKYYVGPNPVFAVFMRTTMDAVLWHHVVTWFLPAQILRGVLIAVVFYPLYDLLSRWSFLKRLFYSASLYLVLGLWAATVAAPGTIEGMVYLRPFITPLVHLTVQPEIVLQGLALALFIAGAMMNPPRFSRGTQITSEESSH